MGGRHASSYSITVPEGSKLCLKCLQALPVEAFGKHTRTKDGFRMRCKQCEKPFNIYSYLSDKTRARKNALRRTPEYKKRRNESLRNRYAADQAFAEKCKAGSSASRAKWPIAERLYRYAKRTAKSRGLEFNLDRSDFICPLVCPILGIALDLGPAASKRTDTSPSVDRINSTRGYIKGNIQIVSWRANNLKSDATLSELEALGSWAVSMRN